LTTDELELFIFDSSVVWSSGVGNKEGISQRKFPEIVRGVVQREIPKTMSSSYSRIGFRREDVIVIFEIYTSALLLRLPKLVLCSANQR